jgi:hypothetical protein
MSTAKQLNFVWTREATDWTASNRELLVGYAIRASLGRFVSALTVTQLVTARPLPDEKWAALRPQLGSDQHHKH